MDLVKIQKNGNGHSIIIPAHVMRALKLERTDVVGCEVINGKLSYEVIRRHAVPQPRHTGVKPSRVSNREAKS